MRPVCFYFAVIASYNIAVIVVEEDAGLVNDFDISRKSREFHCRDFTITYTI
jgi:hypothetical protein